MLEDLVSAEAAVLYQCLLNSGALPLDGEGVSPHTQRVQELLRRGLAFEVPGQRRRLVPQAPIAVFQQLLSERQQHIDTELDTLAREYEQLEQAQRTYTQSTATRRDLARVLTHPDEITAWADHLRFSARWECLLLDPVPMLPADQWHFQEQPTERREKGVRYRNVYALEWLETRWASHLLGLLHEMGEEPRFLPGLNLRMRVADDHTALVALLPQALEGALLVQAPHFVAALRQLFEYFWNQAKPISGNNTPHEDTDLTPAQRTLLRFLVAGIKDEAIARAIGISVKTVRRHVADLLHRLDRKSTR